MSRFAPSRYSDHELPAVVRDVCAHANSTWPLEVTETQFNGGRSAAGYSEAPSAARIARRLKRPWPEVKALALDRKRDTDRSVGRWVGAQQADFLTRDACVLALQHVGERLGKRFKTRRGPAASESDNAEDTMTIVEYEQGAEELRREHARRYLHGGNLYLPTIEQIKWRFGNWNRALAAAGFQRRPHAAGNAAGLDYLDALELCLQETGALATRADLLDFCRANDLRLSEIWKCGVGTHRQMIEQLRTRRASLCLWTPPGYPRIQDRPDYTERVLAEESHNLPGHIWPVTEERCIQCLMRFLVETRGRKQTSAVYVPWAAATRGAPSASRMRAFGGFAALRQKARKRLRDGEKPTV
jgi:hypothetical protein